MHKRQGCRGKGKTGTKRNKNGPKTNTGPNKTTPGPLQSGAYQKRAKQTRAFTKTGPNENRAKPGTNKNVLELWPSPFGMMWNRPSRFASSPASLSGPLGSLSSPLGGTSQSEYLYAPIWLIPVCANMAHRRVTVPRECSKT